MPAIDGLQDAEYAAIGRIAVESAYLDELVQVLIIRLAGIAPGVGEALLARAMLDAKLTILANLGDHLLEKRPAKRQELSALIARIREDNSKRTLAIHGRWVNVTLSDLLTGLGTRNPRAIKFSARPQKQRRELKLADAVTLSSAIEASRDDLWGFAKKTWPQKFATRRAEQRR